VHRNARALFTILIAVVGLLFMSASTAAAEVQDAACLAPSAVFLGPTPSSTARLAETFTALNTGQLTRAQIAIDKGGSTTGDFVIDVRSLDGAGAPTEYVLASTAVLDSSVPNGNSNLTGTFSAPASIVAGQRYALVLSRPGGGQWAVKTNQNNPCPDGQEFVSSGAGVAWTATGAGAYDAVFAVFVTPPAPGTAAAPTGQRAAALRRCKKKFRHNKPKLRKCRRKANLLPI
jgi:hypothetical protein